MRKLLLSILMTLALVLGFIPSTSVFASESGSSSGSFSVGGVAPDVSALQVYSDAGLTLVATALTPQVVYYVKTTISDANTLNDVKEVKIKVFYDVGATHPNESTITTGHEQTAGIFTWTKAGNAWAVNAGAGTSWAVVSASSVTPTMTTSSGDWIFAVKLGKVATESLGTNVWDLHASATDSANITSGYNLWGKTVLWYGEVVINTADIDFGAVALGSGFGANVNKVTGVSIKHIANGDYAINRKSSATWTGSSNIATLDATGNTVNALEFALKSYASDIYGSAVLVDTVGVTAFPSGVQTLETGYTNNAITFWLKIASVFPVDVYSGTISSVIVNR
ncbi:MAG: hypothetical protein Q7J73_09640 [Dehalococcoidales bacterium]|nr:hypothetical protein [Dehalococcoidales bacterium]